MKKRLLRKELVLGIIVLFVGASVVPSISGNFKKMKDESGSVALDNNLIGCWHFDEGSGDIAYDSSSHNNNGTIYGASWVGGISGKALWFDGNDDYVRIFDTNDFEFVNQSFTFFTWVKILNNANEWRMFICLGDIDGPPVVYLGKSRNGYVDGRIIFRVFNSAHQNATCLSVDDGDALPKNQWMHVAGVVNYESNLITLYVNGGVQESQPLVDLNLSEAQHLRLLFGNYSRPDTTYEHHHYGPMDEVHIYNRALNDTEILEYYEDYFPISTVYVDDDYNESTPGWGYDHFDKIQDGADAVNESGTVYVYSGTYYEQIRINKSINLIGEDKNSTFIDGNNVGDVTIRIFVDNVNISGFTIQESGNGYSGLCTYANNTNISNNIVKSNGNHGIIVRYWDNNIISNNIVFDNQQNGINIQDGSKNNLISNNNISENGAQGIRIEQSSYNIISDNEIKENIDDGINLCFHAYSNNISGNIIKNNNDNGIQLYDSCDNNNISDNTITDSGDEGIFLYDSSNNIISRNDVNSVPVSTIGIFLDYSNYNNILTNVVSNNYHGIEFQRSNNNFIIGNNLISNNNSGVWLRYYNCGWEYCTVRSET